MKRKIIITGGAGFIGSNVAAKLIQTGYKIVIIDNLSRKGSSLNIDWLKTFGNFSFIYCDISNYELIKSVITENRDVFCLIHLAAQVAVTSSIIDPKRDFEVNAMGTLNILEAIRQQKIKPLVIYASTNKVYGNLKDITVLEEKTRYKYKDYPMGINESMPLNFYSPYGCSKGAADQYVRDYERIYGIPSVVVRQSCIYGPRQYGIEDQGWVAWFLIAAITGKPIKIYGDGKQVRDLLYIDDLVDFYTKALENPNKVSGKIFNVGGGTSNSLSIWMEFKPILEEILGKEVKFEYQKWRNGDQKIFISDISLARKILKWSPKTSIKEGLEKLYRWVIDNKNIIKKIYNL